MGCTAELVRHRYREPLGFILALTGTSVMNGQCLRCDPTASAPEEIAWRA
jgi:hypothetical protein